MYPSACAKPSATGTVKIYKNGVLYLSFNVRDGFGTPYSYNRQSSWPAGNYSAIVKITWSSVDVKDFTFRTYFPYTFKIKYTSYAADTDATTAVTNVTTFSIPTTDTGSISYPVQLPPTPLIVSKLTFPVPAYPKSFPSGATADLTNTIAKASTYAVSDYTSFKVQKGWVSLTNGHWGYYFRTTPPASGSATITFSFYAYGTNATISYTNGFSSCYQTAATAGGQTIFSCSCTVSSTQGNSCDAMVDIVSASSFGWGASY